MSVKLKMFRTQGVVRSFSEGFLSLSASILGGSMLWRLFMILRSLRQLNPHSGLLAFTSTYSGCL